MLSKMGLNASHETLKASVESLNASHTTLNASHETLNASHATLNAAVTALIESHNRLGRQVEGMRGERAGEKYEAEKRRFGFYIFRGGRDYTGEGEVLLRLASQEGAISLVEAEEANRLDFIWEKLPGGEALPCLFAVEVSLVLNGHDTRRARERAAILARAAQGTHRVMPVVLGQRFTGPDAAREAEELGVEWILEPDVRGYSDGLRPLVVTIAVPSTGFSSAYLSAMWSWVSSKNCWREDVTTLPHAQPRIQLAPAMW